MLQKIKTIPPKILFSLILFLISITLVISVSTISFFRSQNDDPKKNTDNKTKQDLENFEEFKQNSSRKFTANQGSEQGQQDSENPNSSNTFEQDASEQSLNSQEQVVEAGGYRFFSGEDFKNFYDNFEYSKVEQIIDKPFIRGDAATDAKIQEIAESRGYKLRFEADCKCLQTETSQAFEQMKTTASQDGNNLVLVSGFRSVADQRQIFLNQISNFSNQQIINGQVDDSINDILVTRSIPGYSKHHTGYTIDLGCNNSDLLGFKNTSCYEWISANNFLNAKKFGFIPSYPAGANNQGPDPEEWEFVWVGEENLK